MTFVWDPESEGGHNDISGTAHAKPWDKGARAQPKLLGQNRAPCPGQRLRKKCGDHSQSRAGLRQTPTYGTLTPRGGALRPLQLQPQGAPPRLGTRDPQALLIGSEGRAMIGGGSKCVKGLVGIGCRLLRRRRVGQGAFSPGECFR